MTYYTPAGSITFPNDRQNIIVLAGTETPGNRGVAVTPTYKLYGEWLVAKDRPLADRPEYRGGYDPYHTASYGPETVGGTYNQPLTFQDLAILPRYGLAGGVSGSTDGGSPASYLYAYNPHPNRDNLDSITVQSGFPGIPWTDAGARFDEFTISADIDDNDGRWQWASRVVAVDRTLDPLADSGTATGGSATTLVDSGKSWTVNEHAGSYVTIVDATGEGQVREVLSNTATALTVDPAWVTNAAAGSVYEISAPFTPGITDRDRDAIESPGTLLYIDDEGGTIGTSRIDNEFISFSLTWLNAINSKRFMENATGVSKKAGRGKRVVTGTLRLEFDKLREAEAWLGKIGRMIRIRKIGPQINSVPNSHTATVDIHRAFWNTPNFNDFRNDNNVASFPFWAYFDSAEGEVGNIAVRTDISALP